MRLAALVASLALLVGAVADLFLGGLVVAALALGVAAHREEGSCRS